METLDRMARLRCLSRRPAFTKAGCTIRCTRLAEGPASQQRWGRMPPVQAAAAGLLKSHQALAAVGALQTPYLKRRITVRNTTAKAMCLRGPRRQGGRTPASRVLAKFITTACFSTVMLSLRLARDGLHAGLARRGTGDFFDGQRGKDR